MRGLKLTAIGAALAVPLLAAGITIGNGPQPTEAQEVQDDPRTAIVLPAPARAAVLAEMRQMLMALNGVLVGAAHEDVEAISRAALSGGTVMAVDMDPALRALLPEPFMNLGMTTHRAFDELAASLDASDGLDNLFERLGTLTGNCVACHALYRIEEERDGS